MRAVFGVHDEERLRRLRGPDRRLRAARQPDHPDPRPAPQSRSLSPWARFLAARRRSTSSSTRRSACAVEVEAGEEEHDDVLSLLLEARHDDGTPMSDEELRDELVTCSAPATRRPPPGSPGRWSGCCARRGRWPAARVVDAGEDDYLDATIKETLRARPVIVDVARKLTAPARDRRLRAARGHLRAAGDRRPALPRGPLPRAGGVPARALPRGGRPTTTPGSPSAAAFAAASAPPSPNTRCGSCSRDRRAHRAQRPGPAAGEGQGPQHHPGAGQGHPGQAGSPAALTVRSASSHCS